MGQVHNVFLIVAITAIMAIATAIVALFVDMVTPAITGHAHQSTVDALVMITRTTRGH